MTVLGDGGFIRIRRELPDPIEFRVSDYSGTTDSFFAPNDDFWSGDEILLIGGDGIPISFDAIPDGVAMYYGSRWDLAPNRQHITSESDDFYTDNDGVYFYNRGRIVNSENYFIYVDQLGRISFYPDRASALEGRLEDRVPLLKLKFDFITLAAAGTFEYNNAVAKCILKRGEYEYADLRDRLTLESVCDNPPLYETPVAGSEEWDQADLQPRRWVNGFPWVLICGVTEWQLTMDAPAVDTTGVGEKFGENVKSVVTGGGSLNFFLDRQADDRSQGPTILQKLLLATEKGSKAEIELWVIADRDVTGCDSRLSGDLYYRMEGLIVQSGINTRAAGLITGSAQFVTTGEIKLLEGRY